jgi:antitoxin component YwqK of YwqJK toxin-antitoxin module
MCLVELEEIKGLECVQEYHTSTGNLWFDGCRLNDELHGIVKYYYEDGSISSYGEYDEGKKIGEHITYYQYPPEGVDCISEYVDDELVREVCYYTTGEKWSELEFTESGGTGIVYYRSGRISSECDYTSDGLIDCRSFRDDEDHTLCGEKTTDEYGDIVDEWDNCDEFPSS